MSKPKFRPVTITIGGKKRTLRTVLQAGNTLMNDWPEQTPAARAAEMLVLDAINEVASPEEVRRALIAAAKLSDIDCSS
ncbi:DUF982 domain-containing protein [Rhizobium sp. Pop5]|uniref:DUF982 domain-containing protein n=1 Tax=Rhizobium sp. Pop5 TaxID=1223565 RepID=UPI000283566C|nr:DUF982 domain-containing protein [Rhizobium sp. Pop5]EJZ19571.1 hypothetical protein RCCGEPOP_19538 [Rhizobium sp. Pop5]UVD55471.1 DUF982 domain-containing protein [Rhizobium sp. Pop5]